MADEDFGFRLTFPDGWQVGDQVVATEFAEGAECRAVEVVDYQPPEGSTALILHSFVQICARPIEDSLTLEQFMLNSYGPQFGEQFESINHAGILAYHSRREGTDTTAFVQTQGYRIQIVSAVAAPPELLSIRAAQVQAILESFTFVR